MLLFYITFPLVALVVDNADANGSMSVLAATNKTDTGDVHGIVDGYDT